MKEEKENKYWLSYLNSEELEKNAKRDWKYAGVTGYLFTKLELETFKQAVINELLPFKDSYGNNLTVGDKIILESFYSSNIFNGQLAEIIWNDKKGMYEYQFIHKAGYIKEESIIKNNFYGVAKFRKII